MNRARIWGGFSHLPHQRVARTEKQLISEFIECEKDGKVVKVCEELLKRQLIESIDKNFIL